MIKKIINSKESTKTNGERRENRISGTNKKQKENKFKY
jgi:hypothetical protein